MKKMGVDSEFKIGRWHLINKIYDLDKKKLVKLPLLAKFFSSASAFSADCMPPSGSRGAEQEAHVGFIVDGKANNVVDFDRQY